MEKVIEKISEVNGKVNTIAAEILIIMEKVKGKKAERALEDDSEKKDILSREIINLLQSAKELNSELNELYLSTLKYAKEQNELFAMEISKLGKTFYDYQLKISSCSNREII